MSRLGVSAALVDGRMVSGDVEVHRGIVTAVGLEPAVGSAIAVPGLVDLQINGVVGVDLRSADREGYELAAGFLAGRGTTVAQPTFYSQDFDSYRASLGRLADTLADPPPGTRWLPAHLEGPFLSPMCRGAHDASYLLPCDVGVLDELLAAGPVGFMTLAPELGGALALVDHLVRAGVVVSVGHTEASEAQMLAALDAGVRHVTHCWNTMPTPSAREPGPVGVALGDPRPTVGVIADLAHVAAPVLALTVAAARRRVAVTTDAVPLAGTRPGELTAQDDSSRVVEGAPRSEEGTILGGLATPDMCLRNLLGVGVEIGDALDACGSAQRRLLGLDPVRLIPGEPAELVVLDDAMEPLRTFVDGSWFEPS